MWRIRVPVWLYGHAAVALVFLAFIAGGGIPAVRHDWLFPNDRAAFVQRMFDLAFGWNPEGLGAPYAYPMTYWVTLPLAGLCALVGAQAAFVALVAAIGVGAALAAQRIVMRTGLPTRMGPVLGALLLFNPWVYSKVVAGHLTQILAYLGLAVVVVEVAQPRPARLTLASAVALSALQTQLFFVALACCLVRIRSEAARSAILVGLIVYLPSLVGIVLDRNALLAWPFTIAWENQQSVPLQSGALLLGYFTHYPDAAFGGAMTFALIALVLLALAAVVRERRAATWTLALTAVLVLIFCTGTIGPIAPLWRWAILHLPEVAVYRELYDLIAICAIVYVILAAYAFARWPRLQVLGLVLACAFAVAWTVTPPSTLWVWQRDIEPAPTSLATVARYALMPPFQPLSYNGRGAGVDPLYVGTSSTNAPINALLPPTYPAETALARYTRNGHPDELGALGVGLVLCRSGFAETPATRAFYRLPAPTTSCATKTIRAASIVTFAARWSQCSICSSPTAGNVFFADVQGGAIPLAHQREFADPKDGWIDAQLAFASDPDLGQPFGGAYTEQSHLSLSLPAANYALALVRGRLEDDRGTIIARDTHRYLWIALPAGTSSVRCFGACALALTSIARPPTDSDAVNPASALSFTRPVSFLAFVTVPQRAGLLRFTESFDPSWTAIDLGTLHSLAHLRLDGTFNAWVHAASAQPERIALVERTALLQAVAMLPGFVAIVALLVQWLRKDGRLQREKSVQKNVPSRESSS